MSNGEGRPQGRNLRGLAEESGRSAPERRTVHELEDSSVGAQAGQPDSAVVGPPARGPGGPCAAGSARVKVLP